MIRSLGFRHTSLFSRWVFIELVEVERGTFRYDEVFIKKHLVPDGVEWFILGRFDGDSHFYLCTYMASYPKIRREYHRLMANDRVIRGSNIFRVDRWEKFYTPA